MYYFIVNPNAGCGKGGRLWFTLACYIAKHQIEYEAHLTGAAGDACRIARELTDGSGEPKIIIVVGGDGTMNEVLNGLSFNGQITLGYIPAGSGNDLARSLHLAFQPLKGLKRLLSPRHYQMLDYGVLTYGCHEVLPRRFLVSSGIGFDAAVCRQMKKDWSRCLSRAGLGRLSYILSGIRQLFSYKPCKGYIVLDGVKKVEFNHIVFISCHIQPYEGGGFKMAPKARNCTGKLSVCVVSRSSRRKLLSILTAALTGRHVSKKGVKTYECRELVVHTEQALPIHADGEICGLHNDLQIGCIPRQVRIIG